jgi:kynurenine formamidase
LLLTHSKKGGNVMKRTCLSVLVVCIVLSASVALAGAPFGTNWGKWGTDDQLGTLNYITPLKVAEAGKLIKKGVVFNLAIDLKPTTAGWTGRSYQHYMTHITPAFSKEGGIGFTDDMIVMHLQFSTQWDGLSHCVWEGKMYNGYDAPTIARGAPKQLSIHQWADRVVTRGVLLDIARLKGVPNLEKGYEITPEDLEAAAKAQNVEVRTGDILLIRTGWMNVMKQWATPLRGREPYEHGQPGIGLQASKWLKEKEVAAIASDNLGVEVIPFNPEDVKQINDRGFKGFPVHVELLVHQGMPVGEIWNFEELAKDCASDGVYEFFLAAPPLRVVDGVGSVLSPLAIK